MIIAEDEAASKLFDCLVAYGKLANKVELPETSTIEDHITIGVWPTQELAAVVEARAPNRF